MTQRTIQGTELDRSTEPADVLGGGELWIGRHAGDHDILVLDPDESDPGATVLALYSLTHHRTRRFPRATVLERIHVVTDELAHARAKKDYTQRTALREDHQRASDSAREARFDGIREGMIAAHQRFVEALGLEYQGVRKTATDIRGGRASKCHACALPLDDFVGVTCGTCSGVLCSCGACACGKPARGRRGQGAAAASESDE